MLDRTVVSKKVTAKMLVVHMFENLMINEERADEGRKVTERKKNQLDYLIATLDNRILIQY